MKKLLKHNFWRLRLGAMGRLVLGVATAVVLVAPPRQVVLVETCTMYEKYVKDRGSGASCASTSGTGYEDHTPTGGSGILHARKVPYCPDTGLDTGCALDEEARSLDGTRGFYHLDVGSNPTKWVFFLEGGGACGKIQGSSAAMTCMDGSWTAKDIGGEVNDELFFGYNDDDNPHANDARPPRRDWREMTSHHAGGWTIEEAVDGNGILSDNSLNPFASSTRVKLAKTTFDRFMGNTTLTELYNGDRVKLHFHGRRLLNAMFKDLDRPEPDGRPFSVNDEEVPDLSEATEIIVAGHSGGAGGLIHNMEWIKDTLVNIAPNAKIIFVVASRMIPFLEAEAHFANPIYSLYDSQYSGVSTMVTNPGRPGEPLGPITAELIYSEAAFQANGSVRDLLSSWGNPKSETDPFLDQDCTTVHDHRDTNWRCFDEGHVALYHMDEDVFFYQSLLDTVHTNSSPLQWVDTVRLEPAYPHFVMEVSLAPRGGWSFANPIMDPDLNQNGESYSYSMEKSERVVYMADQMWADHRGTGRIAFYVPESNCHTAIVRSAFWADTMTSVLRGEQSFGSYLEFWIDNYINLGNPAPLGTVQDNNTVEKFRGDSVVMSSATCPP